MTERLFLLLKYWSTFTWIPIWVYTYHTYTYMHTHVYIDIIRTRLINIVLSFLFSPDFLGKQWEISPFSYRSALTLYLVWMWKICFVSKELFNAKRAIRMSPFSIFTCYSHYQMRLTQVWPPITVGVCLTSKLAGYCKM